MLEKPLFLPVSLVDDPLPDSQKLLVMVGSSTLIPETRAVDVQEVGLQACNLLEGIVEQVNLHVNLGTLPSFSQSPSIPISLRECDSSGTIPKRCLV